MAKKIILDQEACIKCGTCCVFAPDVFKFESDKIVVNEEAPIDEQTDQVQTAIDNCPVAVIKWAE